MMLKLSISQEGYPRKIVIDKDTVCAISISQLDSINVIYVNLDECHELRDSLNSEINNYIGLVNEKNLIISSKDKELVIEKKINFTQDSVIILDNKIINGHAKKTTWLKTQRNILTGMTVILTSYIIYVKLDNNR